MGYYTGAAVCTRGHAITKDVRRMEVAKRCPDCGAAVLTACRECGARIRGDYHSPGVVAIGFPYDRPKFCDDCGAPFPWVGRKERLYELENVMEQESGLDEATTLWLRE
jgi:hypothetical protein